MNATVQTDFTRTADVTRTDFARFDNLPVHEATTLTEGGVQARILLNGQVYTLRITRAGKLILTK